MEPPHMNRELRAEKFKAQAFDEIRDISTLSGKALMAKGYPNLGAAVRDVIIKTYARIEGSDDT